MLIKTKHNLMKIEVQNKYHPECLESPEWPCRGLEVTSVHLYLSSVNIKCHLLFLSRPVPLLVTPSSLRWAAPKRLMSAPGSRAMSAMASSWVSVPHEKMSSKEDNCERTEPVRTQMKLYGIKPWRRKIRRKQQLCHWICDTSVCLFIFMLLAHLLIQRRRKWIEGCWGQDRWC